ncbi:MAG: BppU family phage baseplate upper protein, partial [Clostridia bacterium]|nr:BppU family phage baseplate upper protein [Clostridia bacterium]
MLKDITARSFDINESPGAFECVQGDSGSRVWNLSITDEDSPDERLNLSGCVASLYLRKPDDHVCILVADSVDADKGCITFTLTEQMTCVSGRAIACIMLTDSQGNLISTQQFAVIIH